MYVKLLNINGAANQEMSWLVWDGKNIGIPKRPKTKANWAIFETFEGVCLFFVSFLLGSKNILDLKN